MLRPYVQNHDPVKVIWHYDESIQDRIREMIGNFQPAFGN